MGWRCFLVKSSPFIQKSFRRYGAGPGDNCPTSFPGSLAYHNAEVILDRSLPAAFHRPEGRFPEADEQRDLRWPKQCACGYSFHPEDHWQVNFESLYEGSPDKQLYRIRELPPGAIYRAEWLEELNDNPYSGPDGKVWCLMMPCEIEWIIYGYSSGDGQDGRGQKWDVGGELPIITVSPSIAMNGRYHGFVKNGIITPDCEGRTFPRWPETV